MWLLDAVIGAVFILFVGFTILPPFVAIMTSLDSSMIQSVPGLTALEEVVMSLYPLAIFLAVLLAAILMFRIKSREDKD